MKKVLLLFALFFMCVGASFAQRTISGVISDDSGLPLIGANVLVKGTAEGTITELDGSFSLEVADDATTLVISYTGFDTQEIDIAGQSTVNVSLSEGNILDEVVVTALGVERDKKSLGYAQQEVDGEELTRVKDANFVNSLSGKIAGLDVKRSSSLGGSSNVVIRGYTSLLGNNQALFVVDGVPIDNSITNTVNMQTGRGGYDYGNTAMDINPEDVESISVLRGAAATALYGSRAANGVILVVTKKGTKGQGLGISVTTGVTAGKIDESTMPRWQTEYGHGYSNWRGWYADGDGLAFDYHDFGLGDGERPVAVVYEDASHGPEYDPSLLVYDWRSFFPELSTYGEAFPFVAAQNNPTTFYETALTYNNSISFDGGNENSSYRLSYTNFDQAGIVPGSKIKKNTISFGGSMDFSDKLTASSSVSYIDTEGKGRYGTGYDNRNINQSFRQWFSPAVDIRDQEKAFEETGSNITWNPYATLDLDKPTQPHYFDNYFWNVNSNYATDERDRMMGNVTLDYEINDWLSIQGRVALDRYNELREERIAIGSVDVSSYERYNSSVSENNTDLLLKFNKYLGANDILSFNGLLGLNINRRSLSSVRALTNGGLVVPGVYSLANSVSSIAAPTEDEWKRGTNGYFGQVSFGYDNFLYVDLAGRYDVSSTLPADNNAYFYPSASLSFLFSEKIDIPGLTYGKIRLNYAEVGNDAQPLALADAYDQNSSFAGVALASASNTKKNSQLVPEKTKSYEIGAELNFFNSRVGLDVSYYNAQSLNQALAGEVTPATGSLSQFVNAGRIDNKGIEVSLNFTPVQTTDFTWDVRFNWAKNTNEVVELFGDQTNLQISTAQGGISFNATVGQPYGTIWGTNYMYDDNGTPIVYEPGESYDGTRHRRTGGPEVIGDINPDWKGGVWNSISYKNIGLSFLIDIQKGGDFFSLDSYYGYATGIYDRSAGLNDKGNPVRSAVSDGGGYNIGGVLQAVDENGEYDFDPDGNAISSGVANTIYGYAEDFFTSDGYWASPNAKYVIDAGYVKLREVALSYNFPDSMVGNSLLQGASLSFIGRNLWIIHKNAPYTDPEAGLSAGTIQQGNQSGAYPAVKEYGVSLNLKF